jgi:hypothetical protein
MRTATELVVEDSAWPEILAAVEAAPYPVRVLPTDPARATASLEAVQVTTRSWLGAVAFHSGGMLVDHGWLRVYGAGSPDRSIPNLATIGPRPPDGIVVGDDVLGGRFWWTQAQPAAEPTVLYFGPDVLDWQDLGVGYGQWLAGMLSGALTTFAENLRWPGWAAEVEACPLDHGLRLYPPPWSVEGQDPGQASRRPVPMAELVALHQETAHQLD